MRARDKDLWPFIRIFDLCYKHFNTVAHGGLVIGRLLWFRTLSAVLSYVGMAQMSVRALATPGHPTLRSVYKFFINDTSFSFTGPLGDHLLCRLSRYPS